MREISLTPCALMRPKAVYLSEEEMAAKASKRQHVLKAECKEEKERRLQEECELEDMPSDDKEDDDFEEKHTKSKKRKTSCTEESEEEGGAKQKRTAKKKKN